MSDPEWLVKLQALAESATPGPWTYSGCYDRNGDKYDREGSINGPTYLQIPDTAAYEPYDAEFIVAANPKTVLWLLKMLKLSVSWRAPEEYENGPNAE